MAVSFLGGLFLKKPLAFGRTSTKPALFPGPASDAIGSRVDVYYNLNKGCLSLRALDGPERGRVVGHADSVVLKDAEFVVQPGGRQRVLKEKRKNVHAFVRGILQAVNSLVRMHPATARPVMYNPYLYDSFVTRDTKEPVVSAPQVLIQGKSVTAQNPVVVSALHSESMAS